MFRYGIIVKVSDGTEEGYPLGWCRVKFPHYDVVSKWIPQLVLYSKDDKELSPLAINTHVVCLMDEFCEDGCVLGAFYTTKDTTPEGAGAGKWVKEYKDGSLESYDTTTHLRKIKVGDMTVEIGENLIKFNGGTLDGLVKIGPLVEKINRLENKLNDLITACTSQVVTLAPSGTFALASFFATVTAIAPVTTKANLENTKIKQ